MLAASVSAWKGLGGDLKGCEREMGGDTRPEIGPSCSPPPSR